MFTVSKRLNYRNFFTASTRPGFFFLSVSRIHTRVRSVRRQVRADFYRAASRGLSTLWSRRYARSYPTASGHADGIDLNRETVVSKRARLTHPRVRVHTWGRWTKNGAKPPPPRRLTIVGFGRRSRGAGDSYLLSVIVPPPTSETLHRHCPLSAPLVCVRFGAWGGRDRTAAKPFLRGGGGGGGQLRGSESSAFNCRVSTAGSYASARPVKRGERYPPVIGALGPFDGDVKIKNSL